MGNDRGSRIERMRRDRALGLAFLLGAAAGGLAAWTVRPRESPGPVLGGEVSGSDGSESRPPGAAGPLRAAAAGRARAHGASRGARRGEGMGRAVRERDGGRAAGGRVRVRRGPRAARRRARDGGLRLRRHRGRRLAPLPARREGPFRAARRRGRPRSCRQSGHPARRRAAGDAATTRVVLLRPALVGRCGGPWARQGGQRRRLQGVDARSPARPERAAQGGSLRIRLGARRS